MSIEALYERCHEPGCDLSPLTMSSRIVTRAVNQSAIDVVLMSDTLY